jgi:hypothetical protein
MLLTYAEQRLHACALENSDPLSMPDICYACCASQLSLRLSVMIGVVTKLPILG